MIYQVVGNYKMTSRCVYKMTPKNPEQVKGKFDHNVGSKGCLYEIHFPDLRELLMNHCQGFIKCSFHIVIELKQMALFRLRARAIFICGSSIHVSMLVLQCSVHFYLHNPTHATLHSRQMPSHPLAMQ